MTNFYDKDYLAKLIRSYRKKAGLTQAELAELADLSVQHVSRIESGCYTPSLKSFFMLISILKIDLFRCGFNTILTENSVKDKLIKNIAMASDEEVVFYNNIMEAVNKSFANI